MGWRDRMKDLPVRSVPRSAFEQAAIGMAQQVSRGHRVGGPKEVTFLAHDELIDELIDEHFADALKYGMSAMQVHHIHVEDPLAKFRDVELVMEMIKRGYAVLKCPEPGVPPETLQPKDEQ